MWPSNAREIRNAIDRRSFLKGASLSLAGAVLQAPSLSWAQPAEGDGLVVREKEPLNLEFPFATLDSFITPNDRFYVRNHFAMPKLETAGWKLKVEGAVKKELELTYDQVRKLPSRTVTATLECAGNNRAYLMPKTKGVQWQLGAVSNAEWTGVPLAAVLEAAAIDAGAVEVVLEGADRGEVKTDIRPEPPVIHFARSLPLAKAKQAEVLLAYQINGKELPVNHGFPLRAVVPGWYGMASIKWLQRIIVTRQPFQGFFQSIDYSYFSLLRGLPQVLPIQEIQVKAQIARPKTGESIKANAEYKVRGAAWGGESEIKKVELSADNGKNWTEARLSGKSVRFAWRLWEYAWKPEKAGPATLLARATDDLGHVQPLKRDPNRRNYMISHSLPVEVIVM